CGMPRYLVGSPNYLKKHGRPRHPLHLAEHVCITYGHGTAGETWRFTHKNGKSATVRPSGPLRVNNGDAMMPALIAGVGLGILPEFILRDALEAGRLERLLADWSPPSGAVYWVTPPGGLRPKRVEEPIAKLPSDNWDCGRSRLAMIARRVFCKPALDHGAVDAMHWQFLDAVRLCGVSSVSN
ncbi:substrate binding domain-containing protein, partial [Pseudomonas sp.]|uniref:substrate binding domain-containing protein n=1 Tax=Pseudomonas sp. TaxID=306 RepID=UPI002E33834B